MAGLKMCTLKLDFRSFGKLHIPDENLIWIFVQLQTFSSRCLMSDILPVERNCDATEIEGFVVRCDFAAMRTRLTEIRMVFKDVDPCFSCVDDVSRR